VSLPLALCLTLAACDREAPGIAGHIETLDQRMKRQEAEFEATPDIKGNVLRTALKSQGIEDKWISPALEENGVEILQLRVPGPEFAKLDHRALARLVLDSRYRFEFVDEGQARIAALHHGAEMHVREQAKALQELKARGQLSSYPRYREGMAMSAFAPQVEAWCGYERGQAFRVVDGGWVDYQHAMVDLAAEDQQGRALASFDCVKRVVDATPELRRRFIGNRGREGAIDY
jgi:hypothetical protein